MDKSQFKTQITGQILAVVITGAVSTAMTVTALNVHLEYIKKELTSLDHTSQQHDQRIRAVELAQVRAAR